MLGILIVVAAAFGYFVISKNGSVGELLKTYSHPSGAFSFKYPDSYHVIEIEGAALIQVAPKTLSESVSPLSAFASLQVMYYPNYDSEAARFLTNPTLTSRNVTLSSNTFKVISFPNRPEYGSKYIMSLYGGENPSIFLVGNVSANTEGFTDEKFEEILKTLTLDKENLILLAKEQASAMQKRVWRPK